jgi:phospholipase/lecithinase/hemolysin
MHAVVQGEWHDDDLHLGVPENPVIAAGGAATSKDQSRIPFAVTWMTRRHIVRIASISRAVTAAIFLGAAGSASAFDRLWVFGDSTVDTGWYNVRPSGESQFDQFLSTWNLARPRNTPPTLGAGKATSNPGPVSVEVLAGLIGTEVLPADGPILPQTLPLVVNQAPARAPAPDLILQLPPGIQSLLLRTNYATGGARNHDVNPPGIGLFPNAVPTETQIANYMSQHRPDGNALYLVSSGGNDVSFALNNPVNDPAAYVTGAADSLAAAIATLQQGGAQFIIVTNLPESFGNPNQKTFRQLYNTELMSKLTALGVSFAWADMNSVRQQIVARPDLFGITHTTNQQVDVACTLPSEGLMISSGWAYVCSPTSPASQPVSPTFAAQALFADNEHWATGGHTVLGSYYYCLALKTWPQQFQQLPLRLDRFFAFPRPQPPIPCATFQPVVTAQ